MFLRIPALELWSTSFFRALTHHALDRLGYSLQTLRMFFDWRHASMCDHVAVLAKASQAGVWKLEGGTC